MVVAQKKLGDVEQPNNPARILEAPDHLSGNLTLIIPQKTNLLVTRLGGVSGSLVFQRAPDPNQSNLRALVPQIQDREEGLSEDGLSKADRFERISAAVKTLVSIGMPAEFVQDVGMALEIPDARRSDLLMTMAETAARGTHFTQEMLDQAARLADISQPVDMGTEEAQFNASLVNAEVLQITGMQIEPQLSLTEPPALQPPQQIEPQDEPTPQPTEPHSEPPPQQNNLSQQIELPPNEVELHSNEASPREDANALQTDPVTNPLTEVGYELAVWLNITEPHALAEFARGLVLGRENETEVFALLPEPVQDAISYLTMDERFRVNAHGSDGVFQAHCLNRRTGARTRIEAVRRRLLRIPELMEQSNAGI